MSQQFPVRHFALRLSCSAACCHLGPEVVQGTPQDQAAEAIAAKIAQYNAM